MKFMQITNQTTNPSTLSSGSQPLTLKTGEVLQATIKEKLPNNEAILQMKGQEVKVKVEGTIPSSGRIQIEVTDASDAVPTIKQAAEKAASNAVSLTDDLNVSPETKSALQKAIDILRRNHVPVTKQGVAEMATYLEKGQGTVEQKLETIAAMAKKGLEFNRAQIKAVHEALHGKGKIRDLLNELTPVRNQDVKKMPNVLKEQGGNRLSSTAEQKLLEALQQYKPELEAAVKALLQKGESIENIINLVKSELSKDGLLNQKLLTQLDDMVQPQKAEPDRTDAVMKALKKDPNINHVLFMAKEVLLDLPPEQQDKLQHALTNAEKLTESGRELAARQELMGILEQIKKDKVSIPQVPKEVYPLNDDFIASLPIQSKDFIVTQISERLSQMAIDFKDVKRDITRNLQTIQSLLDQNKQLPAAQAKPLLEATIKQLDNAILKSDMMLYMDMGTEKKMLKASSQLAEAKKFLENGDRTQAAKIVHDVKNSIEKIIFKPSETRVQHFVSKQLMQLEAPEPTTQLARTMETSMQAVRDTASGRQMFEHLRNLGLTYESDQAQSLIAKAKAQEGADSSMKNALLKLTQANQDQALAQKADQAMTQITGQQLLSKTDSSLQSMMFTIPFLLQDQAEQVKIFVNSKNEQQKIDWENCQLYFLLETKKLGDVGIMLSAVERTLSITIKNDRPDFKEKMTPIALKAKDRLNDIGYKIGAIQFTPFTEEKIVEASKKAEPKRQIPNFTERGYDFSV